MQPRGGWIPSFAHQDSIRWAAFSPDGARILTASADTNATLWEVASGKLVAAFAHQGTVNPSFATRAVDSLPRLINTGPVSKGLHYKGVWDDRGSSERREVILGGL